MRVKFKKICFNPLVSQLILLLFVLFLSSSSHAENNKKISPYTGGIVNGFGWKQMDQLQKIVYVTSYIDSMAYAYLLISSLDKNIINDEILKVIKDNLDDKLIRTTSTEKIVVQVDQFYSDTNNLILPIPVIYLVVKRKLEGNTEAQLNETISIFREFYQPSTSPDTITDKPSSSKALIKGKEVSYGIYYNDNKWKVGNFFETEHAEYKFRHKSGNAFAMVIAEEPQLSLKYLKENAISVMEKEFGSTKIVYEDRRTVNGKEALLLEIEVLSENIPITYYNYYFTDKIGSVQLLTFTYKNLFSKYKNDLIDFLNGLVLFGNGSAQAKSPQTFENNDQPFSGTAWPISKGYVVTNSHVVEGKNNIILVKTDGTKVKAHVVLNDKINDIALLKPELSNKLPFSIPIAKSSPELGSKVFTIGYPHPSLMGGKPKVTIGNINGISGFQNDPRTYQVSVQVQSGNSGGPLLNMRGEAVGIITSKLKAMEIFNWTGDLPQNVNYAVKTPYIKVLLESLPKAENLKELSRSKASIEKLTSRIKNSVMMVIAE